VNKQFDAPTPQGQKRAQSFSLVCIIAVLMATLWPMNPYPRNGVTWLPGVRGLEFERAAVVVSNGFLKLPASDRPQSCTLELLLEPASTKSTIVGFYNPTRARQLLVLQHVDTLVVTHDATVAHDPSQTIRIALDHVFHPAKLAFLAISSGPNGTTVYADGQPVRTFSRYKISSDELSGQIVLGTSPVNYQPWHGVIQGFAIYAKELTAKDALEHYHGWIDPDVHPPDLSAAIARYTFAEATGAVIHSGLASGPNLEIPPVFSVPHKAFLQSPLEEFRPDWRYALNAAAMSQASFH